MENYYRFQIHFFQPIASLCPIEMCLTGCLTIIGHPGIQKSVPLRYCRIPLTELELFLRKIVSLSIELIKTFIFANPYRLLPICVSFIKQPKLYEARSVEIGS